MLPNRVQNLFVFLESATTFRLVRTTNEVVAILITTNQIPDSPRPEEAEKQLFMFDLSPLTTQNILSEGI